MKTSIAGHPLCNLSPFRASGYWTRFSGNPRYSMLYLSRRACQALILLTSLLSWTV